MLYSAAGVTFPSQHGLPPMMTQRAMFPAMLGARATARATFVSGPSVTSVNPGFARTVAIIASTACRFSAERFGGG